MWCWCHVSCSSGLQTSRQPDRHLDRQQLNSYVCMSVLGLKVGGITVHFCVVLGSCFKIKIKLKNFPLEAAFVLIKFNTRWHNSIKPSWNIPPVVTQTSDRQQVFLNYQVCIEPWRTHHKPWQHNTNHDNTSRTMTTHHEPWCNTSRTMTTHDKLWRHITNYDDTSRTMTKHHEPPWNITNHHEITTNYQESPQITTKVTVRY